MEQIRLSTEHVSSFSLVIIYSFWYQLVEVLCPFQHKYGYIRAKRSGMESYPYPEAHLKLKPGLVASYDIQPGNGVGLFW